jgi:hypothetical protein
MMNIVAAFHGYKFTHFADSNTTKTRKPVKLTTPQLLGALLFGVSNPRPVNTKVPSLPYETITIPSNVKLECWMIKADSAKGTVLMFHGFSSCKASMIKKSEELVKMGYNTLLVDFMGSGGSEGNETTIGYKEAVEVKACYDYLQQRGEKNIYLFGSSMGAAAILKAINDYQPKVSGIMIECPFGTMYQTTCARFHQMHVPTIPMATLLDFWGGLECGFNAFTYSPAAYAKSVTCPTLLMYGALDENVSRAETDQIFANLAGKKHLVIFPHAGHDDYLVNHKKEWVSEVDSFLKRK